MSQAQDPSAAGSDTAALPEILRALQRLRYGAVEITVHDGRIVQIERREKIRLESGSPARPLR
jgi:hypothetical protein